jgi:hypothetical protein
MYVEDEVGGGGANKDMIFQKFSVKIEKLVYKVFGSILDN